MSLPVKTRSGAKSSCLNSTDTVLDVSANDVATIYVGTDEQFSANPTQNSKSVGYNTESVAPTSNSKSDKHNSKSNTDRYIIPARRGMLDQKAVPFVPRPSRVKRSPKWMQSPAWCFQLLNMVLCFSEFLFVFLLQINSTFYIQLVYIFSVAGVQRCCIRLV